MSKFAIPENLAVSDSGFLFLPATGETFTLNECAREILRLFQQRKTEEEIIAQIMEDYDIEQSILERDVTEFISQMKNYGLIKQI